MFNRYDEKSQMSVNGLFAQLHTPDALPPGVHSLPPCAPRPAYVVDEYLGCPEDWEHGSNKASSYFVPVESGKGMWFDFTQNQAHAYHVAVVISVQGINPVTGHPTNNEWGMKLQQIKNKCPKHGYDKNGNEIAGGDLQQDRFCPQCKYKLPAQNYLATTTGETLWLDGFRNPDGLVSQYVLTEEECKGVASQIIKKDRVWAIGFAFYLSKEPRPQRQNVIRAASFFGGVSPAAACPDYESGDMLSLADGDLPYSLPSSSSHSCSTSSSSTKGIGGSSVLRSARPSRAKTKKLEVGKGAQIRQEIGVDPNDISFWREEPEGLIYVNYVSEEICRRILEGGKREELTEGFLTGLQSAID